VHKSNTHIIRENLKLKRRIEQLEKKLKTSRTHLIPEKKPVNQSLSLSTILNSTGFLETATTQGLCCCNHGSPSSSKLKSLCSFYQIRSKVGNKRARPTSWFVEKPKKRFLNEVVLSQLPLFKF
jgi:hypothetical protein